MSLRGAACALVIVPLAFALSACDGTTAEPGPASKTPPAKICDDLPYTWATDAVGESDLVGDMSGRIAVTMKDWSGNCAITRPGERLNYLLTISTKRTDADDAKHLSNVIANALKDSRGIPTQTAKGVGVVINDPRSTDGGQHSAAWVCEGSQLQISLRNVGDPATATARLRLLTERIVGLLTCHPPIAT